MPTITKYAHPQYCDLTWSGKGRKPKWVEHWIAQGRTLLDLEFNRNTVPVTEKPPVALAEDQAQLPGLPPIPKKRGRPATGKAKTPAQRKRDSRSVMRDVICWGTVAESSTWIETASIAQLLEAYAVAAKQPNGGGHTCLEIAEVLQRRAQDMIG